MNVLSKGIMSFANGFNLKNEIEDLLIKNSIEFKKIKFFKESKYQKNRFKKEFVGQEVWVTAKNNEKICITQDLYEECKNDNNLEFIKLMFD